MPRGGKRPGAGKPKGYKHAATLDKLAAREMVRQRVTAALAVVAKDLRLAWRDRAGWASAAAFATIAPWGWERVGSGAKAEKLLSVNLARTERGTVVCALLVILLIIMRFWPGAGPGRWRL